MTKYVYVHATIWIIEDVNGDIMQSWVSQAYFQH